MVAEIKQFGLAVGIEAVDLVEGEMAVCRRHLVQRFGSGIQVVCGQSGRFGLRRPSLEQMTFAGAGRPPHIHKQLALPAQHLQQLAVALAEKGVETRRGSGEIEDELVHDVMEAT